ncbi:RNA methyltransferase, TrmH family [Myroides guanonis]|uniref:RNA methyltransferase, TrmH family n=2 Tax=Myroides guanonis TaxID=1150112 RepID=A0A1I3RZB9_9FLAO|nr:RNA methyltransferase, TrmH family [Myroides guanonis]
MASFKMIKKIESVQNPYIKSLVQLQEKAKARKQSNSFIIEGQREIQLAKKGGYELITILYCNEFMNNIDINQYVENHTEIIEISKDVYQKLAYRDTTEGIIAVAQQKTHFLDDLKLSKNPLILIAEALEKPGNIGAILRTADAAKVDAVIIANPKTELYNPNSIRSSVGCVFTNQIALDTTERVIQFLKDKGISIYSATLQDSNAYHLEDFTTPTALVVGTEATGLSSLWRQESSQNINIPMSGEIDSMNVSVAAAILVFEAKRQRNFE